ncbi:hypothetical protein RB195_021692 [Necator americanus]|uniref:Uncharacterized protein n=1 Tax=Necator americanus TaxID=51031 RepID=A0ABR1EC86_NECAM
MGLEQRCGRKMALFHGANIGRRKSSDRSLRTNEPHYCIHIQEESSTPSAYVTRHILMLEDQRKRKMSTLKLDYVLTKQDNTPRDRKIWSGLGHRIRFRPPLSSSQLYGTVPEKDRYQTKFDQADLKKTWNAERSFANK